MRIGIVMSSLLTLSIAAPSLFAQPAAQADDPIAKVKAALPEKAPAKPAKPRKLLVFSLCTGFRHSVIPLASNAFAAMGTKTGAYEAVVSEDPAVFEPASLAQFDAVCLLNTTGELFLPADFDKLSVEKKAAAEKVNARLKQSLLEFVKGGKGLIGIHAATDCFYKWPEFGEMLGGYFDGHPWNEEVGVKIDDPENPICAAFAGQGFTIADEIYQLKEPYSRTKLRVLLSLDVAKTNMKKDGIKRADQDFAVSWVHESGKGRVFYCSLGHRDDIFWNPKVLQHYLAGIQYALGDLKADDQPIPPPPASEAKPAEPKAPAKP
jgi:uncharacterized protein